MNIKFYYDQIKYRIRKTRRLKEFLNKVIAEEKKIPGDLFFIFTNDEKILEINRTFLKHNYYTDVIAFDYSSDKVINGEIYISIDTVLSNSLHYKVTFREELMRVIIHGILHLCGYEDDDKDNREFMHMRQEEILTRLKAV